MSSNTNLSYKRAVRILTGACGLLFSAFSFIYLYLFQGDVLGALHYSLSQGKTHYSPLAGAIIITLVLLIFRWGINGLLGLKGSVRSLSYFPSCLLLGVLTDVNRSLYHGGNFADKWLWLLPLLLIMYVGVVFVLRRIFRHWLDHESSIIGLINSNLAILLILCLMTACIGNSDINFHHELAIENAIREIRESQAEKEETRRIRQELDAFKQEVQEIDTKESDDKIARKIAQIQQRKERHAKRQAEKKENQEKAAAALRNAQSKVQSDSKREIQVGDTVRIKGLTTIGKVENINGDTATAVFGGMRTKMRLNRLEHATATAENVDKTEERKENLASYGISKETRKTIDAHKTNFHQDLDVRGMRGDEALNAVQYFIDDAILVGMPRVRILHGKGNGILRQLIRQYLSSVPNVTHYADEHVQFGGAGITVVDF